MINPGGPGESGIEAALGVVQTLPKRVRERFDLVGFDPRGVGSSRPAIWCNSDADNDRLRTEPNVDYSPAGVAHIEDETKQFVGRCVDKMGKDFLANVGTVNVARDLDAIRAALGDDKLTYLGYSYGTRIGSAYAEAYPQNVRAMILDGAVDPNADPIEADLRQAKGFQDAFNDYATDCAKQSTCPLGTDPAKAVDVYHSLVDPMVDPNNQMIGRPVPTKDPRGLSYSDAIVGTIMALYSPTLWHHLTDGLTELVDHHGDTLLALADMYMRRDSHGHYTNATDARVAINCVDQPPITDRAKVIDEDRRSREIAPFMSYGQVHRRRATGHLRVLAGAAHQQAARRLGARPGADRGGVDHARSGDAVQGRRRLGEPASRLAAHLRRHPAHGRLPGRQLHRRLRDGVSDRRHHAAERRQVLAPAEPTRVRRRARPEIKA